MCIKKQNCFEAVVLFSVIYCLLQVPLFACVCVLFLYFFLVKLSSFCALSSFEIKSQEKRELFLNCHFDDMWLLVFCGSFSWCIGWYAVGD